MMATVKRDLSILGLSSVMIEKGEVVDVEPYSPYEGATSSNYYTVTSGKYGGIVIGKEHLDLGKQK